MDESARQRNPEPTPAETYDQYFVPGMFAPWAEVLLEHASPKPGEHVLDLACGTGIVARTTAPLVAPEGTVTGLDVNPEMLAVARGKPLPAGRAGITWCIGDATATGLGSGTFDLVLCQQGLQFVPDRIAAVKEMARVLVPRGRVAINVWQDLERHPVYHAVCKAEARHLDTSIEAVAGPAFSMGEASNLRALLTAGGFDQVKVTSVSRTVCFPDPERFVMLTTLAAAAVVPELRRMGQVERSELVEAVTRDVGPTLADYTDGSAVKFPMHAHIALACTG